MSGKSWGAYSKELLQPLVDSFFSDESERKAYDAVANYVSSSNSVTADDFVKVLECVHKQSLERLEVKRNLVFTVVKNCGALGLGDLVELGAKCFAADLEIELGQKGKKSGVENVGSCTEGGRGSEKPEE